MIRDKASSSRERRAHVDPGRGRPRGHLARGRRHGGEARRAAATSRRRAGGVVGDGDDRRREWSDKVGEKACEGCFFRAIALYINGVCLVRVRRKYDPPREMAFFSRALEPSVIDILAQSIRSSTLSSQAGHRPNNPVDIRACPDKIRTVPALCTGFTGRTRRAEDRETDERGIT